MEENMSQYHHGLSTSLWLRETPTPKYESLEQNISVDICIVGGGLAGLMTAYYLQKEGRDVCILESNELGSGQSGRSTAHFSYALKDTWKNIEKNHGEKVAKKVALSHVAAIKETLEIIRKENIECDLEIVNGYYFLSKEHIDNNKIDNNEQKNLHKMYDILNLELEAILRLELTEVYLTERIPIHSFNWGPAICYPDQLQLNPVKLITGLANSIIKRRGKIYTNSQAVEIHGGENAFVKLDNELRVSCQSVVVATNSPFNDLLAIHTKQAAYRSYVIGLEVPYGKIPKGLYWEKNSPYHYASLEKFDTKKSEILLVGGEDHKTGQEKNPEKSYLKLEKWAREKFPTAGRLLYKWSGQILEPIDGLAFIGQNPMDEKNVFVITGLSGNGMTYSTIAGSLLSDLIIGRENPLIDIYSPSRISFSTAGVFIKENLNTIFQYKDWFIENQTANLIDLEKDEGLVYRSGFQIIAAYKDLQGHLILNSAICPHLGGIVRWNNVEKSWDCPCHGSRFDCLGKVLEGPAKFNLNPINLPATHPPTAIPIWSEPEANTLV